MESVNGINGRPERVMIHDASPDMTDTFLEVAFRDLERPLRTAKRCSQDLVGASISRTSC